MIKSIQTWGEAGYENMALSAFNALSGLPGFHICQDPGCFLQILPQEKNGATSLTWEFGVIGVRVTAMGHFEGCRLAYRVTHNGARGGYSQTVYADESALCPTFGEAQAMAARMAEENATALAKFIAAIGDEWEPTPENEAFARRRAHKYFEVGISPCLVIE